MARRVNAQVFWSVLAVGVAVALLLLVMAIRPAQSAPAPAKMSDEFVNSIGIDTHVSFGGTPYDQYEAWKAKLGELGVKHVRDAAVDPNDKTVYSRYRDLYNTQGVKSTLNFSDDRRWSPTVTSSMVNNVLAASGNSVENFEGTNEPNNGSNPNWKQDTIDYQRNLFNSVNASSNPSIPVLNAPMKRPYEKKADGSVDFSAYPNLSAYSDWANMHSYPAGNEPTGGNQDEQLLFDNDIPMAQHVGGEGKPITSTETGYENGPNTFNGISEQASAKYIPRLYFEYFNAGVKRTHTYELIDSKTDPNGTTPQAHFGLLRYDLSEKPAFRALENTIDILQDPGPSFKPGSLDYSLGGDTKNVHRTLLQKRDGSFYLVLWQEVPSYDRKAKRDLSVPSKRVTLTLNQPVKAANVYQPNRSVSQVEAYSAPKQIALDVPDEVLVVKLTP